jgi:hypothetical protein
VWSWTGTIVRFHHKVLPPLPGTKTLRLIRRHYKKTPKAENAVRDSIGMGATEEDNKKK